MVVLVTGSSGQMGQALKAVAADHPEMHFYFADSTEGDITNPSLLSSLFESIVPDFCINAAAYTAVDKAESEPEAADLTNNIGAGNIALACRKHGCTLIHISTDFVFDGGKREPYLETDEPNPQGVYGLTKLKGELAIAAACDKYFIVRTSWLYSDFGHNFKKTMLRLASERGSVSVVNDQVGTPTHAIDLANALIKIVFSGSTAYGVYHFSNEGSCTWYDFAKKIFETNKIKIDLHPIPTSAFPTAAKRPAYSVLDKSKVKSAFGIDIKNWDESLLQ